MNRTHSRFTRFFPQFFAFASIWGGAKVRIELILKTALYSGRIGWCAQEPQWMGSLVGRTDIDATQMDGAFHSH